MEMALKRIICELKEMRDGVGSKSKKVLQMKPRCGRTRSHIAPDNDEMPTVESLYLGKWANLPEELLLDIIRRVEESETSWPDRAAVTICASVCKSWREMTKEIVVTPEQCGRLTFPISLKQPGPRESPIQCFIKRDQSTSTYYLYFGLVPSEAENDKLLLAARKFRRATGADFVISLTSNNFSRASNTYLGKLKSSFFGTNFTIYDSQPPPCHVTTTKTACRSSRRFNPKQVSPRVPACNHSIGSISYELNVLRTRGPRRMNCIMDSIPLSSIEEGGKAPTPTSLSQSFDGHTLDSQVKEPLIGMKSFKPLILKNKTPRWHEQLQCWCLNFKGRVTVASVKNFQLVASVEPSPNVSATEQEKAILQFGRIGKDVFTMDYRYPLSAFQAFAICLSSFDTKPACE